MQFTYILFFFVAEYDHIINCVQLVNNLHWNIVMVSCVGEFWCLLFCPLCILSFTFGRSRFVVVVQIRCACVSVYENDFVPLHNYRMELYNMLKWWITLFLSLLARSSCALLSATLNRHFNDQLQSFQQTLFLDLFFLFFFGHSLRYINCNSADWFGG